MEQPTLDDVLAPHPRARRTDPDTSHRAAASVQNLRESQRAVLQLLTEWGPMTDETLVWRYQVQDWRPRQSMSGIRTRRRELVDLGFVQDTGVEEVLASGRKGRVWAVVQTPRTEE